MRSQEYLHFTFDYVTIITTTHIIMWCMYITSTFN